MTLWMAAMIGAAAQVASLCVDPASLSVGAMAAPAGVDCSAKPPAPGQMLSGTVLQVIDGRSVCIAKGPAPSQWVRAELDDSRDASARSAVMAALFAKHLDCVVVSGGSAGVIARCTLGGAPVGQVIDSAANRSAALAWR